MVLIQSVAGMLNETAVKVRDGELEGFESFGAIIVVASMIEAIDENLPSIEPVATLADGWEDMLAVLEGVKDITARWFNKEIASPEVIEELASLLATADEITSRAEDRLTQAYGLPLKELQAWRTETMERLSGIFEHTPTSTPGN